MTELNPPPYLQAGIYPASLDGSTIAGWLQADDAAAQKIREGVIFNNFSSMRVTASGTPQVTIADGRCAIDNGAGGAYLCTNRGTKTLAIQATGPSPRRDIVGARVKDAANGDAGNVWALEVVQGTAGTNPQDPTNLPDFFIPLARVRMDANTSNVASTAIDDMRTFTSAVGGTLVCTSTTRPATTKIPWGQVIFESDTLAVRIWDGSKWALIPTNNAITTQSSGVPTLTLTGVAGQTQELLNLRNSAGTQVARVTIDGLATVRALVATETISVAGNAVAVAGHTHAEVGLATNARGLLSNGSGHQMRFHWSGQGGQPTWLWGGNDNDIANMYVWNPANFSVNFANSANSASSAGFASNSGALAGLGFGAFIRKDINDSVGTQTVYTHVNPMFFTGIGSAPTFTLGLNSNRQVMLATASARRYKKEIADFTVSIEALRALRPRQFKYDGSVEEVYEDSDLLGGFIAEEVAEAVPMAANFIDGKPEDFNDRTLLAGAYKLIGDLYERIEALEGRLAALEQG